MEMRAAAAARVSSASVRPSRVDISSGASYRYRESVKLKYKLKYKLNSKLKFKLSCGTGSESS